MAVVSTKGSPVNPCPICGAESHTCGGPAFHNGETYAQQRAFLIEGGVAMDKSMLPIANRDWFLDREGKLTDNKADAVTLVARANLPVEPYVRDMYGLTTDHMSQGPGYAAAREQADEEGRKSRHPVFDRLEEGGPVAGEADPNKSAERQEAENEENRARQEREENAAAEQDKEEAPKAEAKERAEAEDKEKQRASDKARRGPHEK